MAGSRALTPLLPRLIPRERQTDAMLINVTETVKQDKRSAKTHQICQRKHTAGSNVLSDISILDFLSPPSKSCHFWLQNGNFEALKFPQTNGYIHLLYTVSTYITAGGSRLQLSPSAPGFMLHALHLQITRTANDKSRFPFTAGNYKQEITQVSRNYRPHCVLSSSVSSYLQELFYHF